MHTYVYTHTYIYIYIYIPTYVQSNYILSQICYVSKHSFKIQFHTTLVDCNQFVHDDSPENYVRTSCFPYRIFYNIRHIKQEANFTASNYVTVSILPLIRPSAAQILQIL